MTTQRKKQDLLDLGGPAPDMLALGEHARRLGVAVHWVANRCAAGTWPARTIKIGRRRLVPLIEHERMVAELLAGAGIAAVPARPAPQPPALAAPQQPTKRRPGRPRGAAAAGARGPGERA